MTDFVAVLVLLVGRLECPYDRIMEGWSLEFLWGAERSWWHTPAVQRAWAGPEWA